MTGTDVRVHHEVVVVGAGFAGIGASIKLAEAGFTDHVVLEEGSDVGGTWHWNTYPGVAVDIPSFSYQYSFATSPDWSRLYAPGAECRRYAHEVVETYAVRPRIRFGVRVLAATWIETDSETGSETGSETAGHWSLVLSDSSTLTCTFLVGATGVLTEPKRPDLPGLDDFDGPIVHTARWDHDLELAGRRVGVIGTGASAVQLVPGIAGVPAQLTVFQRTPIWCLPKPDLPLPPRVRGLLRRVPAVRRAARALSQAFVEATFTVPAHYDRYLPLSRLGRRLGLAHLRRSVADPVTRAQLTPAYALGCKLPAFSNTYLRAFDRDDVALETTAIAALTPRGVRLADGREIELDVLVLATGFRVFERGTMPSFSVAGVDGVDLEDWWHEHRLQAYEGVSVPGFPNLFLVLGPYGYNGASYFSLVENQVRHLVRVLSQARARDAARVEVRRGPHDRFTAAMWGRARMQVFRHPSCAAAGSYYVDEHGDVPLRASTTLESTWRSGHFDLDHYAYAPPAPPARPARPASTADGERPTVGGVREDAGHGTGHG